VSTRCWNLPDARREARISADDDATLIGRVRDGDTDAYAVLVRRHAPMAMRTAVLLGAGSDAEDVVQEALVKAYRSLGSFRLDRPFRPWLLRIVANEARNAHRSSARRGAREERDARAPGPGVVDPAVQVADRQAHQDLPRRGPGPHARGRARARRRAGGDRRAAPGADQLRGVNRSDS
jgi:RNA polymerase sigma factor (sigma-70 family)